LNVDLENWKFFRQLVWEKVGAAHLEKELYEIGRKLEMMLAERKQNLPSS